MKDTQSKSLLDLMTKATGLNPLDDSSFITLNYNADGTPDTSPLRKEFRTNFTFRNGDLTLGNQGGYPRKDVLTGAEGVGVRILEQAKKEGLSNEQIQQLPEFKRIKLDMDNDGKISPKEIGAVIFAAGLDMTVANDTTSPQGVSAYFTNEIKVKDIKNLAIEKYPQSTALVARQFLSDNDVKVAEPLTTQEFVKRLVAPLQTPKTVTQLVANAKAVEFGAASKTAVSFDEEAYNTKDKQSINTQKETGLKFGQANFNMDGNAAVLKGAENLGAQMLETARLSGISPEGIQRMPEFKNIKLDLDGDTRITAQELGAVMLAASMKTDITKDKQTSQYKMTTTFDNQLSGSEVAGLLNPRTAFEINVIAKQLLDDNGVEIPTAATDERVMQALAANAAKKPTTKVRGK